MYINELLTDLTEWGLTITDMDEICPTSKLQVLHISK